MIAGYTTTGGAQIPVHIDRTSTLLLGTGKGKEQLLVQLFLRDVLRKRPALFIDANGEHSDYILKYSTDLTVVDLSYPFSLNVLHGVPEDKHPSFASHLLEVIRGPSDVQTTRIDKYIRAGVQTLLSIPGSDLLTLYYMLQDERVLKTVLDNVEDKHLSHIWTQFGSLRGKEKRDNIESTIGRLLYFVLDPRIRQSLGQRTCKLSFTKPVLVTLNEPLFGEENTALIGSLVIARMLLERVGTIYVTEAQRFPIVRTASRLMPVISAVYSLSLFGKRMHAMTGGQMIAFRTTVEDAETLKRSFVIPSGAIQLTELADYSAYVMKGLNPVRFEVPPHSFKQTRARDAILRRSRAKTESSFTRTERFFHE